MCFLFAKERGNKERIIMALYIFLLRPEALPEACEICQVVGLRLGKGAGIGDKASWGQGSSYER